MKYKNPIPVIDLFAGPGGLSEGFSQCRKDGSSVYKICLSVEKEEFAHKTLLLRSFVRQFLPKHPPFEYYQYLRGQITSDELFKRYESLADIAKSEVLSQPRELGNPVDDKVIRKGIRDVCERYPDQPRVLIGGPPCQAYSLAGRSRRAREDRASFEQDEKHFLYQEYLKIVHLLKPTVFVMENVKGLLSATVDNRRMFHRIMDDLTCADYTLYSLSHRSPDPIASVAPSSYIVKAEEYGIPQNRHRLFVVGVRNGYGKRPELLKKSNKVSVIEAIGDLPRIRSHISRRVSGRGILPCGMIEDSSDNWVRLIRIHSDYGWFPRDKRDEVKNIMARLGRNVGESQGDYIMTNIGSNNGGQLMRWCLDSRLGGVLHHVGRSHMADDLLRYFFVSTTGAVCGRSPKLGDFPPELLPQHANAIQAPEHIPHSDRFKVQLGTEPSGTITCHISKDGHYYIHPDPTQCRSLTVREAARLQTFPDNYFFEGPRTEQYRQVGNAVPPLLAYQIAEVVRELLT